MHKMMKFIEHQSFGGSEVLDFAQIPQPVVADTGALLVKVIAIGVNRADILQRQGKYPAPSGESQILGIEICGEVVAAPDPQWLGKSVCGLVAGGAYAEYCLLNPQHAFILPDHFSFEEGAALTEVFLTAYQTLFAIAGLQAGETALIHAGASGVGSAAIQLIKARGAKAIVTTSSEDKVQFCQALGADLAINYRQQDFVSEVQHYCQQVGSTGVNVILDPVAGEYINQNIDCLTMDGKMVVISMLGGRWSEKLDMAKILAKRLTISASTLRNRSDAYKSHLITAFKQDFWTAIEDGDLKPIIDSIYNWTDVAHAHEHIEANANRGKVILTLT